MNTLTGLDQWVVVKLVPRPDGRTDKIPFNYLTRRACNAHEPANWTTHAAAVALAESWADGRWAVGFVITVQDDLFCVDIDHAATDAGWSDTAQQIVAALPGCMVELSQSGQGLHVWGRFPNPPEHACKRTDLGVECYTSSRFIAIGTGQVGEIAPRCDAFPAFVAAWVPPAVASGLDRPASGPRADWNGPADDVELLRRARRSQSAGSVFGGKAAFADLWDRNLPVLARCYPGDGDHGVDWSSVDAACAQHLAFWTGCDEDRIAAMMVSSPLHREKYERGDYLPRTAAYACRMQQEVLQDKPPAAPVSSAPPAPADVAGMTAREGATFLNPQQSALLFKGCIYIADYHRVLVPGGKLYKPDQFRSVYGGYTFAMDARNERTTRNAFEALTESQALCAPMADGTAFQPILPYGAMVENEGRRRANQFWPAQVRRVAGDAGRFTRHLAILFPVEGDQRVFLYWMAHCVQHPGHKSQWMPLLIGVEGNGKSLFSRCLAYAVGHRYTHWPDASKLGEKFNGWMFGKLLICIEDLNISDSGEVWEKLKPMITGECLEIEGKGVDQRTDEVCANSIANSNHKTAIRATLNDRRVSHLWCAQQAAADIARDGLGEAYMSSFYDWLRADGYAIVAEYLHTLPIPAEYGLRWFKGRAPRTSSSAQAIGASMGSVEQEIMECIERGDVGFKGDWVSSGALDKLLERMRRSVAVNKRREIMQALGYDWHPALVNGRVNNPVLPDGSKVKLFIRSDSPDRALTRPADVAAHYTAAQQRV